MFAPHSKFPQDFFCSVKPFLFVCALCILLLLSSSVYCLLKCVNYFKFSFAYDIMQTQQFWPHTMVASLLFVSKLSPSCYTLQTQVTSKKSLGTKIQQQNSRFHAICDRERTETVTGTTKWRNYVTVSRACHLN